MSLVLISAGFIVLRRVAGWGEVGVGGGGELWLRTSVRCSLCHSDPEIF